MKRGRKRRRRGLDDRIVYTVEGGDLKIGAIHENHRAARKDGDEFGDPRVRVRRAFLLYLDRRDVP